MYLENISAEVSQGDIFDSLPFAVMEGTTATVRTARVVLLTQDCEYDKPSTRSILVAEILPLSGVATASQGNVRRNRVASAFYPPPQEAFPESYVDLRAIGRVEKSVVVAEADRGTRLLSLTEEARLALQQQIAGFFGYHR